MSSLICRLFCLICVSSLLSGCPSQEELSSKLSGNWQGQSGNQHWCITLVQESSAKTGEGPAIYRSQASNNNKRSQHVYAAGVWLVGVGGRWQLNLNPHPLDQQLQALPAPENRIESVRYLINTLNSSTLQYVEHNADDSFGDTFSATRVDSCETFFKADQNA